MYVQCTCICFFPCSFFLSYANVVTTTLTVIKDHVTTGEVHVHVLYVGVRGKGRGGNEEEGKG